MLNDIKLRSLAANVSRCPITWKWDSAGGGPWNLFTLWLVTKGVGTLRTDGILFPLSAGDCFLLRRWRPCQGRHGPRNLLTILWIDFVVEGDFDASALPKLHRNISDLVFLSQLERRAIEAHLRGDQASMEGWLKAALHVLAEEDAKLAESSTLAPGRSLMIESLCAKLRERPGDLPSVERMAKSCHCSANHFTRLFKAHTGVSPREFMTKVRMEAAMGLLRMSSHSVGEIAAMLGFGDIFHFSRQFKLFSGVPPRRYREGGPR